MAGSVAPAHDGTDLADRRLGVAIFVLALGTYAFFFGGEGWNQNSHFALTRAVVERGTLHIDGYDASTGDVSRGLGRHNYSNKAPGLSLLAALPYAAIVAVERRLNLSLDDLSTVNQRLVTIAICGVSGALTGVILFLYGRRRLGIGAVSALVATLAVLFGTIVFPYSTVLMAHVPAGLFLLLAFTLTRSRPLSAGAAAGMATACFYVCAAAAVVLAVIVWRTSSWRGAARFVVGGLPLAVALGVYHTICFGSPWRTAVEASTFTGAGLLFGVLSLPTAEALWGLTFSPFRGLFYTSPVLLIALAGLWFMRRRDDLRHERIAVIAVPLLLLLAIAGFNFWHGGWSFGPRYLLPAIPLLGIPMMLAAGRARPLWVVLGALSFIFNFAAAAVNPTPAESYRDPLRQELLPVLVLGRFPDATLRELGWEQIGPADRKVARSTAAANLGEVVFGKGSRASILPALAWIAAGSSVLIAFARRRASLVSSAAS